MFLNSATQFASVAFHDIKVIKKYVFTNGKSVNTNKNYVLTTGKSVKTNKNYNFIMKVFIRIIKVCIEIKAAIFEKMYSEDCYIRKIVILCCYKYYGSGYQLILNLNYLKL